MNLSHTGTLAEMPLIDFCKKDTNRIREHFNRTFGDPIKIICSFPLASTREEFRANYQMAISHLMFKFLFQQEKLGANVELICKNFEFEHDSHSKCGTITGTFESRIKRP